MTLTEPEVTPGAGPALAVRTRSRLAGVAPILLVLTALVVLVLVRQPDFVTPDPLLAFFKRAAPLIILAAGQYFVIVSGEFDLSVGSLITAEVVIAARLIDSDPSNTWPVVGLLVAFGLLVGAVNGLVTTVLRVPSFITTLAMFLILVGAVYAWTGGSPKGGLSEEFRLLGRRGIDIGGAQLPYAVLVLLGVAAVAVLVMRSDFGRTLVAVGDNPRTAELTGVRVGRTKVIAFVLSAICATVAAVLLGGFGGVSFQVGAGLEFTAITAVVLGGVVLGGGRGSVVGAMLGSLTLELLFTAMNFYQISGSLKSAVQGLIIIVAVAVGSVRRR